MAAWRGTKEKASQKEARVETWRESDRGADHKQNC